MILNVNGKLATAASFEAGDKLTVRFEDDPGWWHERVVLYRGGGHDVAILTPGVTSTLRIAQRTGRSICPLGAMATTMNQLWAMWWCSHRLSAWRSSKSWFEKAWSSCLTKLPQIAPQCPLLVRL